MRRKIVNPNDSNKKRRSRLNANHFIAFDRKYKPGDLVYKYTLFHEPGNLSVYTLRGKEFCSVWYENGNEFIDDVHELAEALGYETTLQMLGDFHFWETAIGLKERFGVWPIYRFNWLEVNYGTKIFRIDKTTGIEAQELSEYMRNKWLDSVEMMKRCG